MLILSDLFYSSINNKISFVAIIVVIMKSQLRQSAKTISVRGGVVKNIKTAIEPRRTFQYKWLETALKMFCCKDNSFSSHAF